MTELIQSPVIFDEEQHTYTLGDKHLSGVTSIIKRLALPDMYKDVPQAVLNKAAERGTRVHNNIQLWISGFSQDDNEELQAFLAAFKESGMDGWQSEYLVSDNESVASSIDMVCLDSENNIILCDIKTTSVLHTEYLQWQLSIYAYLFEHQNPGLKAAALKAIHIRDNKCNIVDIERLPDEYVDALLNAYRNGDESFDNPLHTVPDGIEELLKEYASNEQRINEAKAVTDQLDARKKELQEKIVEVMGKDKLSKIDTPIAKVTISADSTKESFDWKTFKDSEQYKHNPDLYGMFVKTSTTKGRVTITVK